MLYADLWQTTLGEIGAVLEAVDPQEVERLLQAIEGADRIFVTGVGRMALMSRAFVMRLMHLGLQAHMVGDTATPAIGPGDLLLANSASGATSLVVQTVRKAREKGAEIAVITAHADSAIGQIADVILRLPAPSKVRGKGEQPSSQPMGSLAEQCLLILLDVLCMMLMNRLGVAEAEMWARHANLE